MENTREDLRHLQTEISSRLKQAGADLVGFAELDWLPPERRYVISIGIAYDPNITSQLDSQVKAFEEYLDLTKNHMEKLLALAGQLLQEHGDEVWIPPISKNLKGLLGDFPHKTAATRAGLGWVGKNALFVSPDFGCGLRLASVLTNAVFSVGVPTKASRCRACRACQNVCPYGAIKGDLWFPGIERGRLLDAFLCSEKREAFIPSLGYKHPCGLCIQACPWTRRYIRRYTRRKSQGVLARN